MSDIKIWEFFFGVGLYLFGLSFLESGLKVLMGRSFKLVLRKYTATPLKAIPIGVISTTLLQSSSVVTLMLLALVGAGVLALPNAIGIIMGSNLGSTFTGWIITYVGFEANIQSAVIPLVAIGAIGYTLFEGRRIAENSFKSLLGLGLIFYGLTTTKSAVLGFKDHFDLIQFSEFGFLVFALAGFVFAAVMQSSSATVVIALSALSVNMINLYEAAAVVVGANLGTTMTAMVATIGGSADRKRVALAHFSFNLVTGSLALLFLYPLIGLSQYLIGIEKPLFNLVLFHSLINVIGILVFIPFVGRFASFLEFRFVDTEDVAPHLDKKKAGLPDTALVLLSNEGQAFFQEVLAFSKRVMYFETSQSSTQTSNFIKKFFSDESILKLYEKLKEREGRILEFGVQIQNESLDSVSSKELSSLLTGIRHCGQAAKSIKDISHNIEEFYASADDLVFALFKELREKQKAIFQSLKEITDLQSKTVIKESLEQLYQDNKYLHSVEFLYKLVRDNQVEKESLSTLLNVYHEIYLCNKSLIEAALELYLIDFNIVKNK